MKGGEGVNFGSLDQAEGWAPWAACMWVLRGMGRGLGPGTVGGGGSLTPEDSLLPDVGTFSPSCGHPLPLAVSPKPGPSRDPNGFLRGLPGVLPPSSLLGTLPRHCTLLPGSPASVLCRGRKHLVLVLLVTIVPAL